MQKLRKKQKTLILCGDWNINFLQPSPHTLDSNNLLLQYNLTLRLLMSYIYGAPSKARNANVVYIWTYI